MARMFRKVTRTWNPITGCLHNCVYCWARRLVESRLKKISRKYSDGFKPSFHPEELNRKFRPGEFVFVSDMGDMWGDWVPDEWILGVLEVVKKHPEATFLFLTKNPYRYFQINDNLEGLKRIGIENVFGLSNAVFGVTLETDDDALYRKYKISKALLPSRRLLWMAFKEKLFEDEPVPHTMISIEPILDFTHAFPEKIVELEPGFVYVGYDNYNNKLPEPPLHKTMELIDRLKEHGITVYTKTLRKAWYER